MSSTSWSAMRRSRRERAVQPQTLNVELIIALALNVAVWAFIGLMGQG